MAGNLGANLLWYGDNLEILRDNVTDESVDLVYLDPPFNSNQAFNVIFAKHPGDAEAAAAQVKAFDDAWHWGPVTDQQYQRYALAGELPTRTANALRAFYTLLGENDAMAYLVNMAPRLVELHRVLKRTGSLYLHCDPTMSHYLKVMLDAIFGAERFRNEIIWKRSHAHNSAHRFGANHDVILFYGKARDSRWNAIYQSYNESYITKHYKHVDETGRRYKRENPTGPGIRHGETGQPWRDINPTAKGRHWVRPPARLEEMDAAGLIYWPDKPGAWPYVRLYLDEMPGAPVQDVWTDIDPINMIAKERVGYPTQKPLALLERIVTASSSEGDVVLDPFCGCGTAVDAAERLGRKWIGIDIAYIAIDIIRGRLSRNYGTSVSYVLRGSPRDLPGADDLAERDKFEFQTWAVIQLDADPSEQRSRDKGVDGVASFYIDRKTTGRVIISVKGGRNVKPEHVRELHGTVATEKAQMGVLIMRGEPTAGMRDAANHAGIYNWPLNGQTYPKIQIITVAQLLQSVRPAIPTQIRPHTHRARAPRLPDAATLLSGRVPVHSRPVDIEPLLGLVNPTHSGLVLTGTTGAKMAEARRRARGVECPIIFDPATYLTWRATPQDPFRVPSGPLDRRALDNFLRETCKAGAHAVLTPTGYIGAADVASLEAVLNAASTLYSQAVVSLPLDITWATFEWIDILIEMASSTPVPKAIMFSGLPREPGAAVEVLANLRRVASGIPQVSVFRTGLGAFDMMAHGALAASIGSSNASRKILPPGDRNLYGKAMEEEEGPSPKVLVRELVSYLPGDSLAERFNGVPAPVCDCRYCGGQPLTRFLGRAEWGQARLHGFAVWTEWLPSLLSEAPLTQRQLSWTRLCQRGIQAHQELSDSARGTPFTPELPLMFWAGEASLPPTVAARLRDRQLSDAMRRGSRAG